MSGSEVPPGIRVETDDLDVELRPDQWLLGFREAYVDSKAIEATTWRGLPVGWCPTDLWTLAEIEASAKPYWWVETDTLYGGLSLWLGALQDVESRGRTISTGDRIPKHLPEHRRVSFLRDSSYDPRVVQRVADVVRGETIAAQAATCVIATGAEDLAGLRTLLDLWAPLVTPGSYLVVDSRLPEADAEIDAFAAPPAVGERVYAFADDPDRARHGLSFCRWLVREGEGLPE